MPCVSISQTTDRDSLKIAPDQVRNVYVGLKQNEEHGRRLSECLEIAESLNQVIQQQNDTIQAVTLRLDGLNATITQKQEQITQKSVQIERLKNRTSWWKTALIVATSFVGGIIIAK